MKCLKDRRHCRFVQSSGDRSVAVVVRCGRLRWFGHLERKGVKDWVFACRNVWVARARCACVCTGTVEQEDFKRSV